MRPIALSPCLEQLFGQYGLPMVTWRLPEEALDLAEASIRASDNSELVQECDSGAGQ